MSLYMVACIGFTFFVAGWHAAAGRWDWLVSICGLWLFIGWQARPVRRGAAFNPDSVWISPSGELQPQPREPVAVPPAPMEPTHGQRMPVDQWTPETFYDATARAWRPKP